MPRQIEILNTAPPGKLQRNIYEFTIFKASIHSTLHFRSLLTLFSYFLSGLLAYQMEHFVIPRLVSVLHTGCTAFLLPL